MEPAVSTGGSVVAQLPRILGAMKRNFLLLFAFAVPLAGCEPLRGVVSEKESRGSVDVACADAALRNTFGKIERWDYVSDGNGFPNGTKVSQLAYFQTDNGSGTATLQIGSVGSSTRLAHSFTGIGATIPEQDFLLAFRAMERAATALQASCNLDLSGMPLKSVGQRVEALQRMRPSGS